MKQCRFCDQLAVALYGFTKGCLCFPEDREQFLCMQHEVRSTPLGEMILLEDYR